MRQSSSAVSHEIYTRPDQGELLTSIDPGECHVINYIPILQGDSASGKIAISCDLPEMPRPLRNGVFANFQTWFVPKAAFPQFAGMDEYLHAYEGLPINALGDTARTPPALFNTITGADVVTAAASTFFKTLGIHIPAGSTIPTDLVDAANLVYNFRLAAHSSRLTRKDYMAENVANALAIPPAFWPKTPKLSSVVPDYEQALVVGSLDLDVVAGTVPVGTLGNSQELLEAFVNGDTTDIRKFQSTGTNHISAIVGTDADAELYGEMAGMFINTTLAAVEKARTTQAFAKLRQAYAGNDATGFDNDDAIVASLMRGVQVDQSVWKRPMLLDSKIVAFNMIERYATDAANLDDSSTVGNASVQLSINVPTTPCGGYVITTCEVLPERLYEAQFDPILDITDRVGYPDALRDIQVTEPVDQWPNKYVDARHTSPEGLYGYVPMNSKWDRYFTRLGGDYFQSDPANPFNEQRAGIWMSEVVDPGYTQDHWLAPSPFPKDVFADLTDKCEVAVRHAVTIRGLTIRGDVLQEANDNFTSVEEA